MLLDGKVALITGGGTGIDAAVARRFTRDGAKVDVMGRRPEPLEEVATEVAGVALAGDAASVEDSRAAVALAIERFGGLDVIVANASGHGLGISLGRRLPIAS